MGIGMAHIPILCLSNQQLNQLNICRNNVYRKIFKLHQWETVSVKELQWFCERLRFKHITDKRKLLFEVVNKVTECCLADMLYNVHLRMGEFVQLCYKYNLDVSAVCNDFRQVVFSL